jgi:hypothetical protein
LKTAYESGYYRTEVAAAQQTPFPWQNKACKDCPFWANSICQVYAEYRSSTSHTCHHFDPWNRATASRFTPGGVARRPLSRSVNGRVFVGGGNGSTRKALPGESGEIEFGEQLLSIE